MPFLCAAPIRFTLLTCSALLMILPPTSAVAERPVHALQKVLVTGGTHAQLKSPEEPQHLLNQVFNSRCQVLSNRRGAQTTFLAGSVADTLELAVLTMTCPVFPTPPAVDCSWNITPSVQLNAPSCGTVENIILDGQGAWQGRVGNLEVPLPTRTGIYDFAMTCTIQSADDTHIGKLNYPLYVTYAEPIAAVGEPTEALYEKAACWGAGFEKGDRQEKVLKGILDGLYRFGKDHWRYGYAEQVGEHPYLFHGREGAYPVFSEPLNCGSAGRCKCYWEDLAEGIHCDFGDCYTFADLFQGISAVAGILTLSQCDTCTFGGTHGYGFLITPDPPSFDAAFPRDIICRNPEKCPTTYYFGTHALVLKPPLYYDATFNNIYPDPAAAVDNVTSYVDRQTKNGKTLYTLTTDTTTIQQILPSFYGAWSFYRYLPPGTPQEEEDDDTLPTRSVVFQQSYFETVPHEEREDLFEALAFEVEIKPDTAGTYALYGALFNDAQRVTKRPDWWEASDTVTIFEAQADELVKARLEFSGEAIYRAGKDGPYTVHFYVIDEDGFSHTTEEPAHTTDYSHQRFGEVAATLKSVTPRWLADGDGEMPRLQVDVTMHVRIPKQLVVQLELVQDDRAVAFAATDCAEPCQAAVETADGYSVDLTLEVPLTAQSETAAGTNPYVLTIALFERTPRLRSLDGWFDADLTPPVR